MRFLLVASCCILGFGLTAPSARADSLPLTVGDAHYLGFVRAFTPQPANLPDMAALINTLITVAPETTATLQPPASGTTYDRRRSTVVTTSFPQAVLTGANKVNTNTGIGINLGTGYTYLIAQYDGPNVGDYVWYVAGLTGMVNIPTSLGPDPLHPTNRARGISHWAVYNPAPVPDGGATLMLLGCALVGVESLRRKLRS